MIQTKESIHELLVRADLLRLLSKGFSYPSFENQTMLDAIIRQLLNNDETPFEIHHLLFDLKDLARCDQENLREYSRLFLKGNFPMSETACCQRNDALADIAAFYSAFGVKAVAGETPDSICHELEFGALLLVKTAIAESEEQRSVTENAYKKFFEEHLHPFCLALYERLFSIETIRLYRVLTELLAKIIHTEDEILKGKENIY